MQTLVARPINAQAFAPYGHLLNVPRDNGRTYFDEQLVSLRAGARASLSLSRQDAWVGDRVVATRLERHRLSSQSFIPLDVDRFMVMVAPKAANGYPDLAGLQAFIVAGDQGITYRADTWHHPMTVFGRPARFAIMMWLDGGADDEEFYDLSEPVQIVVAPIGA